METLDNKEFVIDGWEILATDQGGEFEPVVGRRFFIKLHSEKENRTHYASVSFLKKYTEESFKEFVKTLINQFENQIKREKELNAG